jgi:pimeloyl-ACP methyl ester carboxylesterase
MIAGPTYDQRRECRVPRLRSNGIEIEYETFGDAGDPALVLVMGLGAQLIDWPVDFCELLAAEHFHVIRFDNRDAGLSTSLDDLGTPDLAAVLAGDRAAAPYLLADLAADTVGLLDALGIDRAYRITGSTGPGLRFSDEELSQRAAAKYDRSVRPAGVQRQYAAVIASPDRTPALRHVTVPTLVIHGEVDPLIAVSGGRATADAVPDAELLIIPGMGHDLPVAARPRIAGAIARAAARATAG